MLCQDQPNRIATVSFDGFKECKTAYSFLVLVTGSDLETFRGLSCGSVRLIAI